MSMDPRTGSPYPIVHCDLSDVQGAPGLPPPAVLAREVSRPRGRWRAVGGPETVFLATDSGGVGAFGPVRSTWNGWCSRSRDAGSGRSAPG